MKYFLPLSLFLFWSFQSPSDSSTTTLNVLEHGPHRVGFQSYYPVDLTRPPIPYSDWDGRLYPSVSTESGRVIPIHVWYPTDEEGPTLAIGHYMDLITQLAAEPSEDQSTLSIEIFKKQVKGLGGPELSSEQVEQLRSIQTSALPLAKPQKEHYPLIVFPNGSSPLNQSIMAEYWASHGYVVAALPVMGRFSYGVEASVRGLESAVDDLQFAINELLRLPMVDTEHIALVGNAIESSFVTSFAARSQKVDALVSLEGGLLSQFEQTILSQTNSNDPQNLTVPILAIYAPHPAIQPKYIFHLRYSNRYFAHFPEMTEFHFLNFGAFEALVPGIIGEHDGDVRGGFQAAAQLILQFVDEQLKARSGFSELFQEDGGLTKYSETDTLFQLGGLPIPPNVTELKNVFITEGMAGVVDVFAEHRTIHQDRDPFGWQFYLDFKDWLAWKKDPEYLHRKQLFEMAVQSHADRALAHYYLGSYTNRSGDSIQAVPHFEKALDLLPVDATLEPDLRMQLDSLLRELVR